MKQREVESDLEARWRYHSFPVAQELPFGKEEAERTKNDGRQRAAAYAENVWSETVRPENCSSSFQAPKGSSLHGQAKEEGTTEKQKQEEPLHQTYQQIQDGEVLGQPSGMAILTDLLKKCHRYKRTCAAYLRKVPNNVILERMDRREFMEQDGKRRQSIQPHNTPYHLNFDCVWRNYSCAQPLNIVLRD